MCESKSLDENDVLLVIKMKLTRNPVILISLDEEDEVGIKKWSIFTLNYYQNGLYVQEIFLICDEVGCVLVIFSLKFNFL